MTVFDEAHAPPENAPHTTPLAGVLRRHPAWGAATLRAAAVFLPVAIVLDASWPREHLLAASVLLTGIWFIALATTARSVSASSFALGVPSGVAMGTLLGVAGVSAVGFWVPWLHPGPGQLVIMAFAVFAMSLIGERLAGDRLTPRRRVLIVGSSPRATELVDELAHRKDLPFQCLGEVGRQSENGTGTDDERANRIVALTEAVHRERPDVVVLADEPRADDVIGLLDAGSLGFRVVGLPTFYEHAFGRVPIQTISPMWFMSVLHLYQRPYSRLTKRGFDVAIATIGLAVSAPLMLLVACLVYISDRGPILYRQVRLGEGGKTFEMRKFRTMVVDAEKQGHAIWAQTSDPRVTMVGRVLRKVRLDELPQLWNVLQGNMSIVGPRPERPEFVEQLTADIPFWTRRHLVKPGITGWAQVRHRYTSDISGTAEKLGYDLYYLKHRSLFLDVAILMMTAKTIVSGSGAR